MKYFLIRGFKKVKKNKVWCLFQKCYFQIVGIIIISSSPLFLLNTLPKQILINELLVENLGSGVLDVFSPNNYMGSMMLRKLPIWGFIDKFFLKFLSRGSCFCTPLGGGGPHLLIDYKKGEKMKIWNKQTCRLDPHLSSRRLSSWSGETGSDSGRWTSSVRFRFS